MNSREALPLINRNKQIFLHTISQEKETWVFIWYSRRSKGYGVGHSSLAFNYEGIEYYISFWPQEAPGKKQKFFVSKEGYWSTTRQEDYVRERMDFPPEFSEGRTPDYIRRITGLKTGLMYKKFLEIKVNMPEWYLLGNIPKTKGNFNCAGVVAEILRAGDIENYTLMDIIEPPPESVEICNNIKDRAKHGIWCLQICLSLICIFSLILSASVGLSRRYGSEEYKKWYNEEVPSELQWFVFACAIFSCLGEVCSCVCCLGNNKKKKPSHGFIPDVDYTIEVPLFSGTVVRAPFNTYERLHEYSRLLLIPDGRIKEIVEKAGEKSDRILSQQSPAKFFKPEVSQKEEKFEKGKEKIRQRADDDLEEGLAGYTSS